MNLCVCRGLRLQAWFTRTNMPQLFAPKSYHLKHYVMFKIGHHWLCLLQLLSSHLWFQIESFIQLTHCPNHCDFIHQLDHWCWRSFTGLHHFLHLPPVYWLELKFVVQCAEVLVHPHVVFLCCGTDWLF